MISIQAILFDVGRNLYAANITKDQRDYSTIRGLMDFSWRGWRPLSSLRKSKKVQCPGYRNTCQKSLLELTEADLWNPISPPR